MLNATSFLPSLEMITNNHNLISYLSQISCLGYSDSNPGVELRLLMEDQLIYPLVRTRSTRRSLVINPKNILKWFRIKPGAQGFYGWSSYFRSLCNQHYFLLLKAGRRPNPDKSLICSIGQRTLLRADSISAHSVHS